MLGAAARLCFISSNLAGRSFVRIVEEEWFTTDCALALHVRSKLIQRGRMSRVNCFAAAVAFAETPLSVTNHPVGSNADSSRKPRETGSPCSSSSRPAGLNRALRHNPDSRLHAAQLTHSSSSSSSSPIGSSAAAMASVTASAISSSSDSARSSRISRASAGRMPLRAPMAASSRGFEE